MQLLAKIPLGKSDTIQIPTKISLDIINNIGKDDCLVDFVCFYFLISAMNLAIKLVIGDFALWSYISKGIMAIVLLRALLSFDLKKIINLIIIEIIFLFLFSCTLIFGSSTHDLESIIFNCCFVYIPLGVCVLYVDSTQNLLKKLYYYSWPNHLLLFFTAILYSGDTYLMSLGYALLLQTLIVLDHFFKHYKMIDFFIVIADIIIIFLYCSRGPFLCLGIYVFFKIFLSGEFSQKKRLLFIVGILVVLLSALFILPSMESYLGESRTFSLLFSGEIFYDSGRMDIYKAYIELIKSNPFTGYGVAGGWTVSSYPHNIIIEFMLSFGIPLGCLFFLFLIYKSIRKLYEKNETEKRLLLVFLSMFCQLFISDSFILSPIFFVFLAVLLRKKDENYDRKIIIKHLLPNINILKG